jgi:prepilin-type N-terminal cleavage/methylation domain-containing protein
MSLRRHKTQRGVTMLELMIAITLLSALSTAMLFAIRIGLNSLGKTNTYFTDMRRVIGVDRILTEQIAGYMPVAAICGGGEGTPPRPVLMFQGDAQTMRFVSSYSLTEAARGLPRLLEYQVIPGEDGNSARLVVNETVYTGPASTLGTCAGIALNPLTNTPGPAWRPVAIGPTSFVLADKLAHCSFSYKEETEPNQPDKWYPHWPREFVPAAVHIDWAPLQPDPSHLQLPPVTVPFRPKRNPLVGEMRD